MHPNYSDDNPKFQVKYELLLQKLYHLELLSLHHFLSKSGQFQVTCLKLILLGEVFLSQVFERKLISGNSKYYQILLHI